MQNGKPPKEISVAMSEFLDKVFHGETQENYAIEYGVVVKIELPEDLADKMIFFTKFNPTDIPQ